MILDYAKDPEWANPEMTFVNLTVKMKEFDFEMPFTANPNDSEAHGREIYAMAINGSFGQIADYSPPPLPSIAEQADFAREKRNGLLLETDWSQARDIPTATSSLWIEYRQLLRDIPTQSGFPTDIIWPVKP